MNTSQERYYLLDLLKFVTLLAIVVFHANEFVFFTDSFPLGWNSPLFKMFEFLLARPFSLGGQILVGIVYLLFGIRQKTKKDFIKILALCFVGQILLGIIFNTIEWDIYAYIGVCNLFLIIVPLFILLSPYFIVFCFLILWIPSSFIQGFFIDSVFWDILSGRLTSSNSSSWPLLPWLFFSFLWYGIGLRIKKLDFLKTLNKKEIIIWCLLLVLSLPHLGFYYKVLIGPHFYDYVFNQSPFIFWSNYLVFCLIIRLAFVTSIQERMKQSKSVQMISSLQWVRSVGLCYFISIIYLGLGAKWEDFFYKYPIMFDIYLISIFFVCEYVSRLTTQLFGNVFKRKGSTS